MAAHILVFGNEKGGSGKSTNCMHVATALARMGFKVGALDLDLRQRTFSQYCENRKQHSDKHNLNLAVPVIVELPEVDPAALNDGENIYDRRIGDAVAFMEGRFDFIVIDCPGSHTRLSQVAHSLADTLVTPLNDSFIDFDLLAKIEPES
ncbi:MAG: division plane positioning ATPase MipZ, partial [Litoreibacter sp.]